MPTKPCLRITGMHIERMGAIKKLQLPEDGLGWGGTIPPVVLVGGVNGAGKTTLMEVIVAVLDDCANPGMSGFPFTDLRRQLWIDFEFVSDDGEALKLRWIKGTDEFVSGLITPNCIGYQWSMRGVEVVRQGAPEKWLQAAFATIPGLVYLPSGGRDLLLPVETYKAPGKLPDAREFIYRWTPPQHWKDSLEALLYSLRWEDLNAQAEGRVIPGAFDAYAEEYRQLTGGANRLVWHNATLVVDADGERHSLEELSSGEKQILLLLAELRRHWRPGSLVLIDEPELHLHDALQARLYDRLLALQKERGGQVWLATQSGYMFEVAEPNTRLILRRKSEL